MIPVPSRRLVLCGVAATVASLGIIVFPGAWLPLLAIDLLLVGAAVLDWLITPGPGVVEVMRLAPERMSALAEHPVALLIRNRSQLNLQVRIRDTVPETLQTSTHELRAAGKKGDCPLEEGGQSPFFPAALTGTVGAQCETRWEYYVRPKTRGRFAWGPIHLRYRSLLGLWELRRRVEAAGVVRVYPNLAALHRYHLLAQTHRLDVLGIRKVRLRGGAWEFESLRDYVFGDDTRLIDWKATARRRKPIVRNQEAERNQTVLILVDCGRLMNAEVDGVAKLDHAVNTTLMLSHIALARGDRVGLCTFSHKVHAWVPPRPNLGQNRLITEALYDLRGDFTETDHGRCLRLVRSRYPKRALLVLLTDFVDAATAADMVAHLQLASRRHLVLFVALGDPFLARAARARPVEPLDGFRMAAAVELLHDRREVLERLRQLGAHVLDAEPAAVTAPLINRYLEITFRGLL
jgi:uncharacterized protein (DUF58 family)